MIIETIYKRLKERDRKLTKSGFCRDYLGMSRNYWFTCRHSGADISNDALLSLYGALRRLGDSWLEVSDDRPGTVKNGREQSRFNRELADMVMEELVNRAVA